MAVRSVTVKSITPVTVDLVRSSTWRTGISHPWTIAKFADFDPYIEGEAELSLSATAGLTLISGVSGPSAIVVAGSATLSGTWIISGPANIILAANGRLDALYLISGTSPFILNVVAPRLYKSFKLDHTVPVRRLIVAGNNQIWYEKLNESYTATLPAVGPAGKPTGDTTVVIRRLVAAGSNKIYYEVI